MHDWRGKVVLVTGSSAGFGYELAATFADAGARVVLVARDADRLAAAATRLRDGGGDAEPFAADVTSDQQVQQLFEHVAQRHGRLDVLVNNAGCSMRGTALDTPLGKYRELFELNFLSAVRCTQAAMPHLQASRGHLIQIASLAAKAATPFLGAYPASKAPMQVYCQQLRQELKPRGVHVLLVCPGPIARQDAGRRYAEQATGLPAAAAAPGGGVRLKGIPPRQLAQRILHACRQRQAELIVPGKARLLFALAALWPSAADAVLARMTRSSSSAASATSTS